MILTKFRIQNFKSIIDSGYCAFASDLTVLVGKNESGKTATLQALQYFDKNYTQVPEEALPIDGRSADPSVSICFELTREEIDAIKGDSGVKLADGAADLLINEGLWVTKDGYGRYHLGQEGLDELFSGGKPSGKVPLTHIRIAKEKLQELLNAPHLPAIDFKAANETILKESKDFIRAVKACLTSVKNEQTQMEVVNALRVIVRESAKLAAPAEGKDEDKQAQDKTGEQDQNSASFFLERFVERVPRFIYFSEFTDILPFSVAITELKNSRPVVDFAKISGLDLDFFAGTQDVQRRINYLNRYSADISGNFLEYWNQNEIELAVKTEGDQLLFGVKEKDKAEFFKVDQRSKGFQWFLSFYLRIKAQKGDQNVILIDEPGVNLHAKAQKEILMVLEREIAKDSQTVYTTHCPYLIDPHRLDRIRLVLKDAGTGTVLSRDIHNDEHRESMTPVLTAMGEKRARIVPESGKLNTILTGITDYYFWQALKEYMVAPAHEAINFIPAADETKIEQMVSLMIGYDQKFQILLNHNNDSWKIGQEIKAKFGLGDDKIAFVSEKVGYFTEDLFTWEDLNMYVLNKEPEEEQKTLNSGFLKDNAFNRVMLAREFYDKVKHHRDKVDLSEETVAAFRECFDKLLRRFHAVDTALEELDAEMEKDLGRERKLAEGTVKRRPLFSFLGRK